MRRAGVVVLLVLVVAGCGSAGGKPAATHVTFRAAVIAALGPLVSGQGHEFANPAATAARYDGFAAAVQAAGAPSDEVAGKAAVVSAAHGAAAAWRAYKDPGFSGAPVDVSGVSSAEAAVRQTIAALPKS